MSREHDDIPNPGRSERDSTPAIQPGPAAPTADARRTSTAPPDDATGATASTTSTGVDSNSLLYAVYIPDDAGPHAAALERILRRIPNRWGRGIHVDAGWYPLIVDTDTRLAALEPEYVVHQVKEKYATLRYYCQPSSAIPSPVLLDVFDAITDEAERISAITCELCGEPGALHQTQHQVKTLCAPCADTLGYSPPQS